MSFLPHTFELSTSCGPITIREQGHPHGIPFFVLHGDGRSNSSAIWAPIMDPLARAGFRVICPDMPGYGATPGLRETFRNTGAALVAEMLRKLLGESGTRCILAGRAIGGRVALEVARQCPGLAALVVVSHPVPPPKDVLAGVRASVLVTWAQDDTAGQPYFGPHGAASLVRQLGGCDLVTWRERDYDTPAEFYSSLYCDRVVEFAHRNRRSLARLLRADEPRALFRAAVRRITAAPLEGATGPPLEGAEAAVTHAPPLVKAPEAGTAATEALPEGTSDTGTLQHGADTLGSTDATVFPMAPQAVSDNEAFEASPTEPSCADALNAGPKPSFGAAPLPSQCGIAEQPILHEASLAHESTITSPPLPAQCAPSQVSEAIAAPPLPAQCAPSRVPEAITAPRGASRAPSVRTRSGPGRSPTRPVVPSRSPPRPRHSRSRSPPGRTRPRQGGAPADAPVWDQDEHNPAPQHPRASLFCATSFGRLHVKAQGDPSAPVLFAMHGDGRDSSWLAWRPIMGPLAACGYRVLAVDMPGYGASEGDRYAFRDHAVHVIREIWDALGIPHAVVIGRSVGGKSALLCAAELGARVTHLVLTHPVVPHEAVITAVRAPVLVTWARDDHLGHPYSGPHGAAYLVKTTGCDLLSWTEREYGGDTQRFYATLFCSRVLEFLQRRRR